MKRQRLTVLSYGVALALGLAVTVAATATCPVGTWFGTAPTCKATEKDCTNANLHYWLSNSYGMGTLCLQGLKVLCVSEPKANYSELEWLGSAPACDAKPIDCTRKGKVFITYGAAGDGVKCTSGMKVLCAKPTAAAAEEAAAPEDAAVAANEVKVVGSTIGNDTTVTVTVVPKAGNNIRILPRTAKGPFTITVLSLQIGTNIYLPTRGGGLPKAQPVSISGLGGDSLRVESGPTIFTFNKK